MNRLAWIPVAVAIALLHGCERRYGQSTPDAVVDSMVQMVERGDAGRLPDLLYADTPELRGVYYRLGLVLGHMQDLAETLRDRFPNEVERLQREAAREAGQAIAGSPFGSLFARRGRDDQRDGMERMQTALQGLFADPYGWMRRARGRLSTTQTSDEYAAVLLDGKPVPPVGLGMRKGEDGRWYIMPPTQFLQWADVMPRTFEEHQILAHMLKTLDNVLIDLETEVRSGEHEDLESVAARAGEMAWMPLMLQGLAYGKALEARKTGGGG